tara:strand:+ start:165 stop:281 length:117 start_codon:yes stop_codon:yes gene_type:complete
MVAPQQQKINWEKRFKDYNEYQKELKKQQQLKNRINKK